MVNSFIDVKVFFEDTNLNIKSILGTNAWQDDEEEMYLSVKYLSQYACHDLCRFLVCQAKPATCKRSAFCPRNYMYGKPCLKLGSESGQHQRQGRSLTSSEPECPVENTTELNKKRKDHKDWAMNYISLHKPVIYKHYLEELRMFFHSRIEKHSWHNYGFSRRMNALHLRIKLVHLLNWVSSWWWCVLYLWHTVGSTV